MGKTIAFLKMLRMLWLWTICAGLGASDSLRFQNISVDAGLSQSTVFFVLQDSHGFLWIGTRDGLNRYDGYEFRIFSNDQNRPNTLSENKIRAMVEIEPDLFWVGVEGGGLNLFDARTEQFSAHRHDPSLPDSISSDVVQALFIDSQERLWVGLDRGLDRFEDGRFIHYTSTDQNQPLNVSVIQKDHHGRLWVGSQNGLWYVDEGRGALVSVPLVDGVVQPRVSAILEDRDGVLWVGSAGAGMFRFSRNRETRTTFRAHDSSNHDHHSTNDERSQSICSNLITVLYEDQQGRLWIGSEDGGLDFYDRDAGVFFHHSHRAEDPYSISANTVQSLFQDRNGVLWVGLEGGGLSFLNTRTTQFRHRLNGGLIRSILEDSRGRLWIGTFAEGLLMTEDAERDDFRQFREDDMRGFTANSAMSLAEDPQGLIWIGTDGQGLFSYNPATDRFQHYATDPTNPTSLSCEHVWGLTIDSQGRLWVGTEDGGLNLMDRDAGVFRHWRHDPRNPKSISGDEVRIIFEDRDGVIWVGTEGYGLNRFDPDLELFQNYRHDAEDPTTISDDNIKCFYQDANGDLWIGTTNGLNWFDPQSETFVSYGVVDGLPNDVIYSILPDGFGRLWVSTNRGLASFQLENGPKVAQAGRTAQTQRVLNDILLYDYRDGLQSNEFNTNAYARGAGNRLYFGGINGFNSFFPKTILRDETPPPVVLTQFLLGNQPVVIGAEDGPLSSAVHRQERISLKYGKAMFSFDFAALHYINPETNTYAYKLEGFDREWIETDAANRRATYTGVPAGDYTFHVRAANSDGVWNDDGARVAVTLRAPWWWNWPAKFAYMGIALLFGFLYWRDLQNRVQRRQLVAEQERRLAEQAHQNAEQLRQSNRRKDEFLANTSHELRTPLNAIIGLAEAMVDGAGGPLPPQTRYSLMMIVNSGKRLANLVNDILDFSKLRKKGLVLKTGAVDVRSATDVVFTLLQPLRIGKDIQFVNEVPYGAPPVEADEYRFQQILINLVENAIKFTDKGFITVSALQAGDQLLISINDTGVGMSNDKLSSLLEAFSRPDQGDTIIYGAGLGLSICKQLVDLHNGELNVTSTLGVGSTFSLTLPIADVTAPVPKLMVDEDGNTLDFEEPAAVERHAVSGPKHAEIDALNRPSRSPEPENPKDETVTITTAEAETSTDQSVETSARMSSLMASARILVVDDEPANCKVIDNHLSLRGYEVVACHSAKEALELLAHQSFDLVLLDVMMPGMSGYEACAKIREQTSVTELPVLFLSGKSRTEDLLTSFDVGGNDYLTKPIAKDELLARVATHLRLLNMHRTLERRVQARTREVEETTKRLLDQQQHMMAQARTVSLSSLTTGVAHELRNPLNFIINFSDTTIALAEELRECLDETDVVHPRRDLIDQRIADIVKDAEAIVQRGGHAGDMISRIMELTGDAEPTVVLTDINELVGEYTQIVGAQGEHLIRLNLDPDLERMPCIPQELGRVISNLIQNARDALTAKTDADQQGEITVTTRDCDDTYQICVQDNGEGIPESQLNNVFEPFFTTRATEAGKMGLGLSLCREIVHDLHHGDIEIRSRLNVFTEVCVTLSKSLQVSRPEPLDLEVGR